MSRRPQAHQAKQSRANFFKPSHVELVLSAIDLEGCTDQQPAAVAAQIERAAMNLGAPFQTLAELRADARLEVDQKPSGSSSI